MTRVLLSVTFDGDIRLAPKHRPDRVVALTSPSEWKGWRIEVHADTVHVFSPPVSPREDADELMRRGAATCETVIPRSRCVLTWAYPAESKPATEEPPAAVTATPGERVAVQAPVTSHAVTVPQNAPALAHAVAQAAIAAPPRPAVPAPTRRKLPPGAEPVMAPPPSRIDVATASEPFHESALVVE